MLKQGVRKKSCPICDGQFAKQGGSWTAGGQTLWSLACASCGTLHMDPDMAIPKAEVEHPDEAKLLDGPYRAWRLAAGKAISSGSVLLITDLLNQHAQMAFGPGVQVHELAWSELEQPWKTLLEVPRDTKLPDNLPEKVDWVLWWHGLEHTRRPLAHLSALLKRANQGIWVGMPPWPWFPGARTTWLSRFSPQHRFHAGPVQMERLAKEVYAESTGPFAPDNLSVPGKGKERWLYRIQRSISKA